MGGIDDYPNTIGILSPPIDLVLFGLVIDSCDVDGVAFIRLPYVAVVVCSSACVIVSPVDCIVVVFKDPFEAVRIGLLGQGLGGGVEAHEEGYLGSGG